MQRIVGFDYDKIHAEIKDYFKGKKIQAKSNISIKEVLQQKLDIVPKEQNVLKFKFEFKVEYAPNIAEIVFTGFILGVFDKNKAKDILKKWKNKKISDEIKIPLLNFILTKCSLKALSLEEEFGLPPHIPLPKFKPKSSGKTDYAG